MPSLKLKRSAVQPLIDAGIYDKWLSNLKVQWNHKALLNTNLKIHLEEITNAGDLLNRSMIWDITPEGYSFWQEWKNKLI
jgi:hypothetical protein